MAFVPLPVGGRIELTVLGSFDGVSELANVYEFQNTGSAITTEADLFEDMEDIIDALYSILESLYWINVIWNRFRVRYYGEEYTSGVVSLVAPIPGTRSDGTEAPGVAGLVFFPLGLAGRQLRKYVGPLGLGRVDPATGALSGYTVATLGTYSDALMTTISGTNSNWRYGIADPLSAGFLVPSSAAISAQAAYQRRRKPGVGS